VDRIDKIYATIILEKALTKGGLLLEREERGLANWERLQEKKLELLARKQIYLDLHVLC